MSAEIRDMRSVSYMVGARVYRKYLCALCPWTAASIAGDEYLAGVVRQHSDQHRRPASVGRKPSWR